MFPGMDGWRIRDDLLDDLLDADAGADADDRCYDDDGDGVHCRVRVPGDGNSNLCVLPTFWAVSVCCQYLRCWKSINQQILRE